MAGNANSGHRKRTGNPIITFRLDKAVLAKAKRLARTKALPLAVYFRSIITENVQGK